MNITETLVQKIEKDGTALKDRRDVYNSLDKAIADGHFEFISNGKNNIGWFSWVITKDGVYGNNLFIEKKYRGTFNLRWLIRYLRDQHKGIGAISWHNRKKDKPVRINL